MRGKYKGQNEAAPAEPNFRNMPNHDKPAIRAEVALAGACCVCASKTQFLRTGPFGLFDEERCTACGQLHHFE